MTFVLPELPYGHDALAPHISRETLQTHHGKHHAAYVKNANELVRGTSWAGQPLERVVAESAAQAAHRALFNNAAQAWNHAFYWRSMRPNGGGPAAGEIARRIEVELGGHAGFVEKFGAAAKGLFGSGWAWLVLDGGRLKVVQTANGDTPLAHGQIPLLTCDVWEHAYYLDYQNRRPDYVEAFIAHLIDWDFVNANLAAGSQRRAAKAQAETAPVQRA